jgi:hypothetical protein
MIRWHDRDLDGRPRARRPGKTVCVVIGLAFTLIEQHPSLVRLAG